MLEDSLAGVSKVTRIFMGPSIQHREPEAELGGEDAPQGSKPPDLDWGSFHERVSEAKLPENTSLRSVVLHGMPKPKWAVRRGGCV